MQTRAEACAARIWKSLEEIGPAAKDPKPMPAKWGEIVLREVSIALSESLREQREMLGGRHS